MNQGIIAGLINNAALLLALGVLYNSISLRSFKSKTLADILSGIILGGIVTGVIINAIALWPGAIFDTRSVLLSLAAFFFGAVPALIAGLFAIVIRLCIGGSGALIGTMVIVASVLCGLIFRRHHRRIGRPYNTWEFLALALVTHIIMLILMLLFPRGERFEVLRNISLPVMVIYPIVTVLLGRMLARSEVQRLEQAVIHQNEERYRTLYQEAPMAYQSLDINGNILNVNKSWLNILNYDMDEVIGHNFSEFLMPGYLEHFHENFPHFKRVGEINDIRFEMKRKDGDAVLVSFNGRIAVNQDGSFRQTHCVFTDVTEKSRAETALRSIEWMLTKQHVEAETVSSYCDLTVLNSDGLILKSVGSDVLYGLVSDYLSLLDNSAAVYEKDGTYALWMFSSAWCQFMDQSSRNLCGTLDNAEAMASGKWLCHESCWTECSRKCIESGEPFEVKCNGGISIYSVPVRTSSEVVGAINFGFGDPPTDEKALSELADSYQIDLNELKKRSAQYMHRPAFIVEQAKRKLHTSARIIGEIIERKQQEEALKQSEARFRTIVETANEGIWAMNKEMKTTIVNQRMLDMLGYAEEEMLGRKVSDFMPASDLNDHNSKMNERQQGKAGHYERNFIRKDGKEICLLVSSKALMNSEGEFEGSFAMFSDITQLKDAEHKITEYTQDLEHTVEERTRQLENA